MEKYIWMRTRKLRNGENITRHDYVHAMRTVTGLLASMVAEEETHPVKVNKINYSDTETRPQWMVKYKNERCLATYVGNIVLNGGTPKHIFKIEY